MQLMGIGPSIARLSFTSSNRKCCPRGGLNENSPALQALGSRFRNAISPWNGRLKYTIPYSVVRSRGLILLSMRIPALKRWA